MTVSDSIRISIAIIVVGVCIWIARKIRPGDSDLEAPLEEVVTSQPESIEHSSQQSAGGWRFWFSSPPEKDLLHEVRRIRMILEWFLILNLLGLLVGFLVPSEKM